MLASNEEWQRMSADMAADREDAEYYLLHYEEELMRYRQARAEALNGDAKGAGGPGGSKGNMPGKPTESMAIKRAAFDESYPAYLWLKAVEIVQRGLGERKNIFIGTRREAEKENRGKGKKAWVVYVQQHYIEALQKRYFTDISYIGERTVHAWWGDVVRRVIEIHCRLKK